MFSRLLVRSAPVLLGAALACGMHAEAIAQHRQWSSGLPSADALSPGFSQNSVHDPSSTNYNALLPSNTGWRTFSNGATFGNGVTFGNSIVGGVAYGTGGLFYGFYPGYYSPYAYGYGYGYPYYPRPFYGAAPWVAPIAAPAAVAPQVAGAVGGKAAVGGFGVLAPDPPVEKPRNKPRASTAESKARAQRQIELGDASFSRQSFLDATQHYRSAATAAVDIPEPLFRQGFSLFALGRYDQAAKMFRKALEMDPDWPTLGFRLSTLYGDNQLSKGAHLDALAQAVTKGQNADLLFLLGLVLFADDEPERARPFLLRARDLNVGSAAHIDAFLKQLGPPAQQVAGPPAARPVAGVPVAGGPAGGVPAAAEKPPAANNAPRVVPASKGSPARPARPGSVDL